MVVEQHLHDPGQVGLDSQVERDLVAYVLLVDGYLLVNQHQDDVWVFGIGTVLDGVEEGVAALFIGEVDDALRVVHQDLDHLGVTLFAGGHEECLAEGVLETEIGVVSTI